MNVIEKRDFIHSYLHRAHESTINEFYEKLRQEEVLKGKLESRARKSEKDIHSGNVFTRDEVEQRAINTGLK
jgi:septin family protein